jgi:hypothetical protein
MAGETVSGLLDQGNSVCFPAGPLSTMTTLRVHVATAQASQSTMRHGPMARLVLLHAGESHWMQLRSYKHACNKELDSHAGLISIVAGMLP